jgi:exonuclease SbcC
MKPLKLQFVGINSFSERVEIDFERVSKSGLFGIFGDTGSGKSTILDSINFALYGDVDRSKKKTDIINYNCEQAEVTFVFDILSEGIRKKYTVERSIKKKSGLGKAMLYEEAQGSNVCIADNTSSVNAKIEDILGLNAEDFRKCIALPQGEFSQFVKSTDAERFKLMERLFDLYKYGDRLKEKISIRENEILSEQAEINGRLSAYSQISEDAKKVFSDSLSEAKNQLNDFIEGDKQAKANLESITNDYTNTQTLLSNIQRLKELEGKKADIDNLRQNITSIVACKAAVETQNLIAQKTALKQKDEEAQKSTVEQINQFKDKLKSVADKIYEGNFDENISAGTQKLAAFQASMDSVAQLNALNEKLTKLRADYSAVTKDGTRLKEGQESLQKVVNDIKEQIDAFSKADIKSFFEDNFKHSVLNDEYRKQINYFADLRDSIKSYSYEKSLYEYIYNECNIRIKYYENLIIASNNADVDVEKKIKELQDATEKKDKLTSKYNEEFAKLSKLQNEAFKNATSEQNILQEGEELSARAKVLKGNLSNVFGDVTNYDRAIDDLQRQVDGYKKQQSSLNEKLESLRRQLEAANLNEARLNERIIAENNELTALNEQLTLNISKTCFTNIEDCKRLIAKFDDVAKAQNTINEYDKEVILVMAKINELSDKYLNSQTTLKDVANAKEQVAKAEAALRDKHAEIKLYESKLAEICVKLDEKKAIEAQLNEVTQSRNLISQLKELTRGNKFLEYIASEYLAEIADIATNTLLKLTDGRYFLRYIDSYYVGDNYNGGNLRGVNTLSGGEIFLASLSLALALSSAICAKSCKSIEFFFLDEGFGTLDTDLVDTVMDCLEKLKSSDFTIGIISHVEELKHRIDNKLLVNKATQSHGSTISFVGA